MSGLSKHGQEWMESERVRLIRETDARAYTIATALVLSVERSPVNGTQEEDRKWPQHEAAAVARACLTEKSMHEAWRKRATEAEAALASKEAECRELRRRNAEIAHAGDLRNAELQSRVAKYENAFAEAKERVKGYSADWLADKTKEVPGSAWAYTSVVTREALAYMASEMLEAQAQSSALQEQVRGMRREALEEAAKVNRVAAIISRLHTEQQDKALTSGGDPYAIDALAMARAIVKDLHE